MLLQNHSAHPKDLFPLRLQPSWRPQFQHHLEAMPRDWAVSAPVRAMKRLNPTADLGCSFVSEQLSMIGSLLGIVDK